jgi:hypothetical protein
MIRARRRSSSSLWVGTDCWVARHCPTTRDARRSETERVACAWHTASRRRAGLEVSCGHLLHDTIVEREIGHQALQSRILLFQTLQPFGLLDTQAAVFVLPPIVRLLGDAELPAGVCDPNTLACLNLNGPSMADDRFRRLPCACHAPSFRRLESSLQTRPGV